MADKTTARGWSSNYLFLLASIGSTVGLSNVWKFTYLVGENGGGAFVLVYLLSLLIIGIPVLVAELMIGRRGGQSIVGSMLVLSKKEGISKYWQYFGWIALLGVFLILSFYCVIAGLTIDYAIFSLMGSLSHLDAQSAVSYYNDVLGSPIRIMFFQGLFVAATVWIVAKGVQGGLEKSVSWMMPALFIILVVLLVYAAITGEFLKALKFMFAPDFSKLTPAVVMTAFGQAFFSLGIGLGVMLTYGAYMPRKSSILRSAVTISLADGLAAILSGLAIFPIVFQYGLSPTEGPGLLFMTLPIAFGQMPGGGFVGALFFILLMFAALSSSISLLESIISRLEEVSSWGRKRISIVVGIFLWILGLGTVFSFNIWADFTPLDMIKPLQGKTIFGLIDYFGSNILMPIGGILMAIIGGWVLSKESSREELNIKDERLFYIWRFLVRYIAPAVVLVIFISNLS
ncbi:MAG: sodium-dependent transporter [Cyclobacteriaceae bacterium]|nr:sodium-dependent transporter [Cyclobacteriaceae bacterium]